MITGQMIADAWKLFDKRDDEGVWISEMMNLHFGIDGTIDCNKFADCLNEVIKGEQK